MTLLRRAVLTFIPCPSSGWHFQTLGTLLTTVPDTWGCKTCPYHGTFAFTSLTSRGNAFQQLLSSHKSPGVSYQCMWKTPQTLGTLNTFRSLTTTASSPWQTFPIAIFIAEIFPALVLLSLMIPLDLMISKGPLQPLSFCDSVIPCASGDLEVVTQDKQSSPGLIWLFITFGVCSPAYHQEYGL